MAKENKGGHKPATRLVALILCALLAITTIVMAFISVASFSAYAEEMPATAISLSVAEGGGGARALQTTRFVNNTSKRLNEVLFAVTANSLRRIDTLPFEAAALDETYPNGYAPGGIDFRSVQVDGQEAQWGVQGDSEAFVRVAVTLEPGASCVFRFDYDLLLPDAQGFLGTGDMGWRLSFFYPRAPVYDDSQGEFRTVSLTPYGRNAYFDRQDFTVTVDMPDTWLCAHGGADGARAEKDGRATETFTLPGARDLALALGRKYAVARRESSGVMLSAYGNAFMGASRALGAAQEMIAYMTELTGSCPISALSLAQVDYAGGWEAHDGLIFLDSALYAQPEKLRLTVYEGVARQWFGLSVAADPALEPWLTDSLCRYLALLCVRARDGESAFARALNDNSLESLHITLPGSLEVDAALSQFQSALEYELVVGGRGAVALNELRLSLGDEAFERALGLYYQAKCGDVASIADFAAALTEAAGRNMDLMLTDTLRGVDRYVEMNLDWYE